MASALPPLPGRPPPPAPPAELKVLSQWRLELIREERQYVGELQRLWDVFAKDLLFDAKLPKPSLLPATQDLTLFLGLVESMLTLDKALLGDLETSSSPVAALGLLSRYASLFKIYAMYVAKHDGVVDRMMGHAMEGESGYHSTKTYLAVSSSSSSSSPSSETFKRWLEERCRSQPEWDGATPPLVQLRALLVLPLDRLPCYIRTLKQVRAKLGTEAKLGVGEVTEALAALEATQEHIKSHKDAEAQKAVIYRLEQQWGHKFSALGRQLVREGDLVKLSRRTDITYRFLLFTDVLVYGSEAPTVPGQSPSFQHHRTLPLATMAVALNASSITTSTSGGGGSPMSTSSSSTAPATDLSSEDTEGKSFLISSPDKSFCVVCRSVEERKAWVAALTEQINRAKATAGLTISTAVGHLASSRLDGSSADVGDDDMEGPSPRPVVDLVVPHAPVWKQDSSSNACSLCSKKFTVIRRRHHCRRCGELFCNDCCKTKLPMSRVLPGHPSSVLKRVCDPCVQLVTSSATDLLSSPPSLRDQSLSSDGGSGMSLGSSSDSAEQLGDRPLSVSNDSHSAPVSSSGSSGSSGPSSARRGSGSGLGLSALRGLVGPVLHSASFHGPTLSSLVSPTHSSASITTPPPAVGPAVSLRPPGANLSTKTAAMEAAQQRVTDLIKCIRDEPEQSRSVKGRRQRVVEEMLVTEHTYVSNLEILLTLYVQPLLHDSASRSPTIGKVCGLSSADKVTSMSDFLHSVEPLHTLNAQLLTAMADKVLDLSVSYLAAWLWLALQVQSWDPSSSTVGDLFSQFAPLFSLYSRYTDAQEFASRTLAECCASGSYKDLASFVSSVDAQQGGQGLQSLLIMPIQRVPRYVLLLQEYLKQTQREAPEHPDVMLVQQALDRVKEAATHINEVIRQRENKERVIQLSSQWVGYQFLTSTDRRLVKEGPLLKQCRRKLKMFQFVLLSDVLVYGEQATGPSSGQQSSGSGSSGVLVLFHREIPLGQCGVLDHPKDDTAFQVLSTRKAFVVKARSASERQAWVEALSKAIEDYHLLRRQSSDKLSVRAAEAAGPSSSSAGAVGGQQGRFAAVWVPDSQSKSCGLCTKEFTLLVRRHHCRVCGSLVCNACSPHRLRVEAIDPKRAVRVCTSCKDSNTTVTVEQDEDQEGQGEDGEHEPTGDGRDSPRNHHGAEAKPGTGPTLVLMLPGEEPAPVPVLSPKGSPVVQKLLLSQEFQKMADEFKSKTMRGMVLPQDDDDDDDDDRSSSSSSSSLSGDEDGPPPEEDMGAWLPQGVAEQTEKAVA